MAFIISSIRDYSRWVSTVFQGLRLVFMFGGAINVGRGRRFCVG
jgi:hypothetical protein